MDKNEYKVKLDEIEKCVDTGNYAEAARIADQIDWKRVRNVRTLCLVSEIYEAENRYEDSKALLLRAYRRTPVGRAILYRLVEVTIKLKQFDEAIEYYSEYVQAAPHDTSRFILKYKIYRGRGSSAEEQIAVLKEYLDQEYNEKYAYELARLYQEADRIPECLNTVDDLVLWFHSGKYVTKALELKKKYAPLTPKQQEIYDHRFEEDEEDEDEIGQEKQIVGTEDTSLAETIVEDTTREIAGEIARAAEDLQGEDLPEEESSATRVMDEDADIRIAGNPGRDEEAALDEPDGSEQRSYADEQELAEGEPETDSAVYDEEADAAWEEETGTDEAGADEAFAEEEAGAEEASAQEQAEEPQDGFSKYSTQELQSEMIRSMREIVSGVGIRDTSDADQEEIDRVIEQSKQEQEGTGAPDSSRINLNSRLTVPQMQSRREAGQLSIDDVLLSMGDRGNAVREAASRAGSPVKPQPEGVLSAVDEALLNMGVRGFEPEVPQEPVQDDDYDEEEAVFGAVREEEVQAEEEYNNAANAAEAGAEAVDETVEAQAEEVPEDVEAQVEEVPEDVETQVEEVPEDVETQAEEMLDGAAETAEEAEAQAEEVLDDAAEAVEEAEEQAEELPDGAAEAAEDAEAQAEEVLDDAAEAAEEIDLFEEEEEEPDDEKARIEDEAVKAFEGRVDQEIEEAGKAALDAQAASEQENFDEDIRILEKIPHAADKAADKAAERTAQQEQTAEAGKAAQDAGQDLSMEDIIRAKTRRIPTEEILQEASLKEEEHEEAVQEHGQKKYLKDSLRGFFDGYLEIQNMERQIAAAIEQALRKGNDRTSRTGNILIFGGHGCGKTTIATGLAKAIAQEQGNQFVKMARIYATDLNRKDIAATVAKIAGGVLIVEEAGDLDDGVADQLTTAMEFRTDGLILILEDEQRYMHDLLMRHPRLTMKFTSQIYIPVFTVEELVGFGKLYADDHDYVIGEDAESALGRKLTAMASQGDALSITSVLDLVDQAFVRANKFGRKLFSGRKRYDSEGRIVLLEKDFR